MLDKQSGNCDFNLVKNSKFIVISTWLRITEKALNENDAYLAFFSGSSCLQNTDGKEYRKN